METPPEDDEDARQRANLLAAIAVICLIIAAVWLMLKYKESSKQMECEMSGRRNCNPIDIPAN